jgi:hypothetical protein
MDKVTVTRRSFVGLIGGLAALLFAPMLPLRQWWSREKPAELAVLVKGDMVMLHNASARPVAFRLNIIGLMEQDEGKRYASADEHIAASTARAERETVRLQPGQMFAWTRPGSQT